MPWQIALGAVAIAGLIFILTAGVGLRERVVAERGEEGSLGDLCLEELYSFVGESWEQEDDITLLTLKRFASSSSAS